MASPPWMAAPGREVTSHTWVDEARRRILTCRDPVTIAGPPGSGRTRAAAAIAARHTGPSLGVRLSGCRNAADVTRALGYVLDVPLPGEAARVGAALGERGEVLVVLDEADAPDTLDAIRICAAYAPRAIFLATGGRPLVPDADLEPPAEWASPQISGAQVDALPPSVEVLAHLPAGLPVDTVQALPESARARTPADLMAIQPRVATEVRLHRPIPPERVARRVAHLANRFLPLATGGSCAPPTQAEILLLRLLAEHLSDTGDAALQVSALARVLAATGQPEEGLAALEAFRSLRRLPLREEALLLWAEGDVLLDTGLEGEARLCHGLAVERLGDVKDPDLAGTLLRRQADRVLTRGHLREAESLYTRARTLHRNSGDAVAVAATLRGVADVAVAAGEVVAAGALFDQAAATLEGRPRARLELANLRLGQAALAIARGELTEAERLLEEARHAGSGSPLTQALVRRRRAELLLRQGRQDEAWKLLEETSNTLFRLGERAAAAAAIRVQGDVSAAAGRRVEASKLYARALGEAARVGDLATTRRALTHLLALERTGTDVGRIEELQLLLGAVTAVFEEGSRAGPSGTS